MKTARVFRSVSVVVIGLAVTAARARCQKPGADSTRAGASSTRAAGAPSASKLPADFPLAPALSACRPIVTGPETICEWHGVDGHAVFAFYHEALPKAGYTLLPGAQEGQEPGHNYMGAIGFKKTGVQGAVSIIGGDVTLQVLTGETH